MQLSLKDYASFTIVAIAIGVVIIALMGGVSNVFPAKRATAEEWELQTHDLINQERVKAGLAPLRWDNDLAQTAREHSLWMSAHNTMEHSDSFCLGENVARSEGGPMSPEQTVDGWMNSEGHRKNILSGDFTKEGIGIYRGAEGDFYTENFC